MVRRQCAPGVPMATATVVRWRLTEQALLDRAPAVHVGVHDGPDLAHHVQSRIRLHALQTGKGAGEQTGGKHSSGAKHRLLLGMVPRVFSWGWCQYERVHLHENTSSTVTSWRRQRLPPRWSGVHCTFGTGHCGAPPGATGPELQLWDQGWGPPRTLGYDHHTVVCQWYTYSVQCTVVGYYHDVP